MVQELIFAEQTLNFEFEGTTLVCYLEPPPFALSLGETYTMRYGVYSYECESYAVENNGVAIDNGRTDAQSITVVSRAEGVTVVSGGTRSVNIAIYKRTYSASLFDERRVGFHYQSAYGAYGYMTNEAQVLLTEGEKYYVIWDDTEYEVRAYDASSVLPGYLYLGNGSAFGLQGDSEPFIIASSGEFVACLSTVDTEELSHWIAIYAAEEEEESPYDSNDISLKRYSGEDRIYEDVEVVHLIHASGEGTVPYSRGRAIENVPITLDFQNGEDQTVTAPDGTLVKSAIIAKPEDLSPENVRYGKVIANVVGEFIGDTEEVESELWFTDDYQTIFPTAEGKSMSKVVILKPDTMIGDNIRSGIVIAGVKGTMAVETEEIDVELNLATGNQVVYPSSDKVHISKVTIIKPENLKKEHIAAGVEIAGITGEFQGATGDLPQLYAPTAISTLSTDSSGRKYFTVTNPYTKNGMFPRTLQLMASAADGSDIIAGEVTLSTTTYTSTVTVYAANFTRALALFQPRARFAGDMFRPSDTFMNASVIASVMAILYELTNATLATKYDFAFEGDVLNLTLTPGGGYYLPKSVMVVGEDIDGGSFSPTYTYTPSSKSLTLTCSSGGKAVNNISIAVEAVSVPWLATPTITTFSYPTLQATCDPNTKQAVLYINGVEVNRYNYSYVSASYSVNSVSGVTYGFTYNSSTGYYTSTNKNVHSSFALCRLNFNVVGGSSTVVLQYINYAENNWDFGIISQIDTTLLRSYTEDTSGVLRSFKSSSSSTAYTLSITIPEGSHFIEIKYRKDGSASSNNDDFRFKVNSMTTGGGLPTINLSGYMDQYRYGPNDIELVAIADGYTESDPAVRTYTLPLTVTRSGTTLSVTGTIPPSVTAYELYIDNTLSDTIAYDGSGSWSIDLRDYQVEDNNTHSIYVMAIGDGIPAYKSNVITAYLNWHTITYYDSDGETVLHTATVEPNATLGYKPTKSGYIFIGWSPELVPVTADASYVASWEVKVDFATASWADIAAVSEAGKASLHFAIGDAKEVTLTTGTKMTFEIIGFDHDNKSDGTGKAGITVFSKYVLNGTSDENGTGSGYCMYGTANSKNIHWSATTIRSLLNSGSIYSTIPDDIKAVVKSVNKVTTNSGSRVTAYTTTADKFWLLSRQEAGYTGYDSWSSNQEGPKYSAFTSTTSTNMDAKLLKTTRDGASASWWFRTPYNGGTYSMYYYIHQTANGTSAALKEGNAWANYGIAFGFCV